LPGSRGKGEGRGGMDHEKNKGFKQLKVWQKAYELVLEVYKISKIFPKDELYGLLSQIRRAAVSVLANIAEGYERKHRKEYLQFLHIAKGSLGEVETFLHLAKDLRYLSEEKFLLIEQKRKETARLLRGLIRSLS
ncbi:MAG: four helix bundle protein, partial [Desulfatiglandales bacterium]|nr:four helix bundle protein [Desulfatiglandales bacterium]